MKKLTIGLLPVTNQIVVGKLNKAGTMWLSGRQDITDDCVKCISSILEKNGIRYEHDGKTYELKEIEIKPEEK